MQNIAKKQDVYFLKHNILQKNAKTWQIFAKECNYCKKQDVYFIKHNFLQKNEKPAKILQKKQNIANNKK